MSAVDLSIIQATRRGDRARFTCAHPKLTVQEKWGQAAIRQWFFDPPLLAERPRLHRAPANYLRLRARRLAIDGLRGIAFIRRILLRGMPGAGELLGKVGSASARDGALKLRC